MTSGWNLPPGVTVGMIERAYGYNDEELPLPMEEGWPRCACGAILKLEPEEPPTGAPDTPPCPRHGHDWHACDEALTRAIMGTTEDGIEDPELADEIASCDPTISGYEYRTCKRCGAITRTEVW